MFTTTTVSIAGSLFYVEDAGYAMLAAYLDALFRAFPGADGLDVRQDVEIRIAELLLDRASDDGVVTQSDVQAVLGRLGPIEGDPGDASDPAAASPRTARRRLFRDGDAPIIGGVCGGIARRLGTWPTLVRLLFIAATFALGFGLLLYLLLWVTVPVARTASQRLERDGLPVSAATLAGAVPEPRAARRWWEYALFGPFILAGLVLRRYQSGLRRGIGAAIALLVFAAAASAWVALVEAFQVPLFGPATQFVFATTTYLAAGLVAFGALTFGLRMVRVVNAPPRAFWKALAGTLVLVLAIAFAFTFRYETLTDYTAATTERLPFAPDSADLVLAIAPPQVDGLDVEDVRLEVHPLPAGASSYAEVSLLGTGPDEAEAYENVAALTLRYRLDAATLTVAPRLDRGANSGVYRRESARLAVYLPDGMRLAIVGGYRLSSVRLVDDRGPTWAERRSSTSTIEFFAQDGRLYRVDGAFTNAFDRGERFQVRQAAHALRDVLAPQAVYYQPSANADSAAAARADSSATVIRTFYQAAGQSHRWTPDDLRAHLDAIRPLAESTEALLQIERLGEVLTRRERVLSRLDALPPVAPEVPSAPLVVL